ncbi:hypothetical protein NM208_g16322 [Fusarium decemcellulare]|uniref:Uncharacterized protein n=1 Tax=Fusarium decemcellulare TaxID=57161 RepID=A0ACC1RAI3_9HYPO|nr:hypothetical protein NM208_g16322 [Fusarium decemcellulare]
MPRAAQIKSRHYKYQSEQLAGRSLWPRGGRGWEDGSELGAEFGRANGRRAAFPRCVSRICGAMATASPSAPANPPLPIPNEPEPEADPQSGERRNADGLACLALPARSDTIDPASPETQLDFHSKS